MEFHNLGNITSVNRRFLCQEIVPYRVLFELAPEQIDILDFLYNTIIARPSRYMAPNIAQLLIFIYGLSWEPRVL